LIVNIFTVEPYPLGNAGTNRIHQLALGFIKNHVKTRVFVISPVGRTNVSNTYGIFEGVHFRYVSVRTEASSHGVMLVFDRVAIILKVLKLFFRLNSQNTLNIMVGGGTMDSRNLIAVMSCFFKSKLYLETNELPFVNESNSLLGYMKRFLFYRLTLPFYDGHIVISTALEDHLLSKVKRGTPVFKIPILSDLNVKKRRRNSNRPLKEPYIIYAGSFIDYKDGFLDVLRAFAKYSLRNSSLCFVMAGDYTNSKDKKLVDGLLEKHKIKARVLFPGYLNREELKCYYQHASLAIVNKPLTKQNIYGFNTKLAEYIQYEIPLILSDVGENANYFSDGMNALIVPPGDIEAIECAIHKIFSNKGLSTHLSTNASIMASKKFNAGIYIGELLNSLK